MIQQPPFDAATDLSWPAELPDDLVARLAIPLSLHTIGTVAAKGLSVFLVSHFSEYRAVHRVVKRFAVMTSTSHQNQVTIQTRLLRPGDKILSEGWCRVVVACTCDRDDARILRNTIDLAMR